MIRTAASVLTTDDEPILVKFNRPLTRLILPAECHGELSEYSRLVILNSFCPELLANYSGRFTGLDSNYVALRAVGS